MKQGTIVRIEGEQGLRQQKSILKGTCKHPPDDISVEAPAVKKIVKNSSGPDINASNKATEKCAEGPQTLDVQVAVTYQNKQSTEDCIAHGAHRSVTDGVANRAAHNNTHATHSTEPISALSNSISGYTISNINVTVNKN